MPNNKHLNLDDRSRIQSCLNAGHSFHKIAKELDKDPSTISKEVRKHRTPLSTGAIGRTPNKCIHRMDCDVRLLCDKKDCKLSFCRYCKLCNRICPEFEEEHCPSLSKPPYVCNACKLLHRCVLKKFLYRAIPANDAYTTVLSESRTGLSYSEQELLYMDEIISPLVKKKQSLHHICVSQANNILCCERTIYTLIEQGVLSVRNIDLPRKVRYRIRKRKKPFKVDKNCLMGRTYQDYQSYIKENPDIPVVQMDTVEGTKGGKVLLTIFFTQSDLMLMYLRDHNTSQSVIDVFNTLDEILGRETFMRLFPLILTDNGSEFSNPKAIEYDAYGEQRTKIFYCEPFSPHQKPEIERNHEFIRMVLPKGMSFDHLTQPYVNLLTCHVNSLIRKKLNDRSAITTFNFFQGDTILPKLDILAIPPEEVTLSPELLRLAKGGEQHGKDLQ